MEMDKHWMEVMKLAEKYGYIIHAYGGMAVLATHQTQLEMFGEKEYKRIQKMNGRNSDNMDRPICKQCGKEMEWAEYLENDGKDFAADFVCVVCPPECMKS